MKNSFSFIAAIFIVLSGASVVHAQEGLSYPGKIVYVSTGQAVVFSHKAHVEDFGIGCDECHSKIFEVKKFAAREKGDFRMQSLYDGRYCGACHNGSRAFASDDFEQCNRCHTGATEAEQAESNKKMIGPKEAIKLGSGDSFAVFRHGAHAAFSCNACHLTLFPLKKTKTITTMDEINQKKSCGSCHNGEKAFDASDCGKCHPRM